MLDRWIFNLKTCLRPPQTFPVLVRRLYLLIDRYLYCLRNINQRAIVYLKMFNDFSDTSARPIKKPSTKCGTKEPSTSTASNPKALCFRCRSTLVKIWTICAICGPIKILKQSDFLSLNLWHISKFISNVFLFIFLKFSRRSC